MDACTTKGVLGSALKEHGFAFQNGECLLQAIDFCRATFNALLISLRLSNASLLDTCKVFIHCVEFCLDPSAIGLGLSGSLFEALAFLCLVLDILILCGFCDLVLFGR